MGQLEDDENRRRSAAMVDGMLTSRWGIWRGVPLTYADPMSEDVERAVEIALRLALEARAADTVELGTEVEMHAFAEGARQRFLDGVSHLIVSEVVPVGVLVSKLGQDPALVFAHAARQLRDLADQVEGLQLEA